MYGLITGATSGIGKEFAINLAKKGYDLILTGRRVKEINDLKNQLENLYKIKVILVIGDFSEKTVLDNIFETIKDKKIKFLINNVGYGNTNSFFETSVEESLKMIDIHIGVTVRLCHYIVPFMEEYGYILNVSSLAAFFPTPYNHIYASTKIFLIGFSESLNFSLQTKKIEVKVLLPGFTFTDFHRDINLKNKNIFWMKSKKVVDITMKNLDKKNILIIPGFFNKFFYISSKLLPKRFLYYFLKKQKEL